MDIKVITKIINADEVSNYEIGVSARLYGDDSVEEFIKAVIETFYIQVIPGKYNLLNVNKVLVISTLADQSNNDVKMLRQDKLESAKLCVAVMRSVAGSIRTTSKHLSDKLLYCAEKGCPKCYLKQN